MRPRGDHGQVAGVLVHVGGPARVVLAVHVLTVPVQVGLPGQQGPQRSALHARVMLQPGRVQQRLGQVDQFHQRIAPPVRLDDAGE